MKDPRKKRLQEKINRKNEQLDEKIYEYESVDNWKENYPNANVGPEEKYQKILHENELLKKEIQEMKSNDSGNKKLKYMNERSCIMIEKKVNEVELLRQKNYESTVQINNL